MSLREADSAGFFVRDRRMGDRLDFSSLPSAIGAARLRRVHLSRTRAVMRVQESLFALLIAGTRTISQ